MFNSKEKKVVIKDIEETTNRLFNEYKIRKKRKEEYMKDNQFNTEKRKRNKRHIENSNFDSIFNGSTLMLKENQSKERINLGKNNQMHLISFLYYHLNNYGKSKNLMIIKFALGKRKKAL